MSFYFRREYSVSENRTAGGPGDSDSDEFRSYDLDLEEYSPDDYESDYFEDEIGELYEDRAQEMQDRVEDMLDGFK